MYEITMCYEGKQNKDTRNMKNVNFLPKNAQKILLSKYNEQEVFYKKLFLRISS